MLIDVKMKKKYSGIRSQWLFERLRRSCHLSPFLQNGKVYLANFFFLSFSRTLMLIGIKMKKKKLLQN